MTVDSDNSFSFIIARRICPETFSDDRPFSLPSKETRKNDWNISPPGGWSERKKKIIFPRYGETLADGENLN